MFCVTDIVRYSSRSEVLCYWLSPQDSVTGRIMHFDFHYFMRNNFESLSASRLSDPGGYTQDWYEFESNHPSPSDAEV